MDRMTPAEIEDLAARALGLAGAAPHQALPVARSIRRAEEDGIGPVGLGYLPTYVAHLRGGKLCGDARPVVAQPRPGTVRVDAAHGFAHPAFEVGLPALAQAARANGVAAMAISRSYSIGVLGHPVEDIARLGLVALAMTNSPPNMAVWGGRRKIFGTNPIAFAVPRAPDPLVVDMATTVVTKVALAERAATGASIPPDWAIDAQGRATTDAKAAMAGAMLPFGGAKGANVALLVELFAALLTGAVASRDVQPYAVARGEPPGVGQFFLACDPDAFAPGFADRLAALAAAIVAEPGVRLPGDRRLASRAAASRVGIAVPSDLLARIESDA
jgi:(2R)-3-sulfolactate dehydrogenase (NADP+)